MQEALRICLLGEHFAPLMGGAERRAEQLARQLQAMSHQVVIVTLRHRRWWRRRERLDDLDVVRIGGVYRRNGELRIGRLGIWPAMLLVAMALWRRRGQYDVIHVMQISPLAAVAALVGELTRTPVILCLQSLGSELTISDTPSEEATLPSDPAVRRSRRDESGGLEALRQSVIGGPLLAYWLRRAPVVYQALSRRGVAYLTARGIPAERIAHISGSVDTVRYHPASFPPDSAPTARRDVVCVARCEYSKGVDVLLRAWALLGLPDAAGETSSQPRLLLIGDGALQSQLEALAGQLGIHERVVFMGRRDDIPAILQRGYAFVLPSRWEGMSNALLEAMACGLPCVAARVSGSEDVLTDGVNGLLVPPEQPEALCAALQRLLGDPTEAARLGHAARATIEHAYSLPAVTDQCVALYRRLTTGARHVEHLTLARRGIP